MQFKVLVKEKKLCVSRTPLYIQVQNSVILEKWLRNVLCPWNPYLRKHLTRNKSHTTFTKEITVYN